MNRRETVKTKFQRMSAALARAVFLLPLALGGCKAPLMDPAGQIGVAEKQLILTALVLMLLVVVPVIVMAIVFAVRYRAGHPTATYSPSWDSSYAVEAVVWGVPLAIVVVLSVICWRSTHELDPKRALKSDVPALEIDVIALDWKWLFVYPQQGIAAVNQVAFPVGTPVHFVITSDSVMNSFFIPQLGSQIYAMTGMVSDLNLIADRAGTYDGESANFSGQGFSGMTFKALALPQNGFDGWVAQARGAAEALDKPAYDALARPTESEPVKFYSSTEPDLFRTVVAHYMNMPMAKDGSKTPMIMDGRVETSHMESIGAGHAQ